MGIGEYLVVISPLYLHGRIGHDNKELSAALGSVLHSRKGKHCNRASIFPRSLTHHIIYPKNDLSST